MPSSNRSVYGLGDGLGRVFQNPNRASWPAIQDLDDKTLAFQVLPFSREPFVLEPFYNIKHTSLPLKIKYEQSVFIVKKEKIQMKNRSITCNTTIRRATVNT